MLELVTYKPSIPKLMAGTIGFSMIPLVVMPGRSWGELPVCLGLFALLVTLGRRLFTVRLTANKIEGPRSGVGPGRIEIALSEVQLPPADETAIAAKSGEPTISLAWLSKTSRSRLLEALEHRLDVRRP